MVKKDGTPFYEAHEIMAVFFGQATAGETTTPSWIFAVSVSPYHHLPEADRYPVTYLAMELQYSSSAQYQSAYVRLANRIEFGSGFYPYREADAICVAM